MHNPIKVEFARRQFPASDETVARRVNTVERLDNMGHIDSDAGKVNTTETQWCARLGDTTVPVLDFSVQKLNDGRVAISLVAVVDAVSIGDPDGAEPATSPTADEQAVEERLRMVVDRLTFAEQVGRETTALTTLAALRERMPSLGPQVAANAERMPHDHSLAKWTCGCDPVLSGIRDAARKAGRINVIPVNVGSLGEQVARNAEVTA